jgi:hypothetical protein
MKFIFSSILLLVTCIQFSFGQTFTNGYHFSLPFNDSSQQAFLPKFNTSPITDADSVRVVGNKFIVRNAPYKFMGSNFVGTAGFPSAAYAQTVAAHAAKLGMNLFRFHHLDNPWTTSLFSGGQSRIIDSNNLRTLHYFLFQLAQHGIYSNINLNVTRQFTALDGVQGADSIIEFAKGITIFDPQLVALQKEFAKNYLTAINPYSGKSIATDPSTAMVELINENTLYGMWKGDQLVHVNNNGILLKRHIQWLDSAWNSFLKNKYTNQNGLLTAWGNYGAVGAEMLVDGGFEGTSFASNWLLEQNGGASASATISTTQHSAGNQSTLLHATNSLGINWHLQWKHNNFSVQKDSTYKITYKLKSATPRSVNVILMRDNSPYNGYGYQQINVDTFWQTYSMVATSNEDNNNTTRLSFSFGDALGDFWLDEVSMSKVVKTGVQSFENLNTNSVSRHLYSQHLAYGDQRNRDMSEFYIGLQKHFMEDMRRYLIDSCGVRAPITGTNALAGIQDAYEHQNMDYYDDHAYWNHPNFPGNAWDNNNWFIPNDAMVKSASLDAITSCISGIGMQNKPYTISEYNHPAPNIYKSEMMPAITSFGSFHGADAIMLFDYNGAFETEYNNDYINYWFDLHSDHSIMGQMPAMSYAFRNHLIDEAIPTIVNYSPQDIYNTFHFDNQGRWGKYTPYEKSLQLNNSIQVGTYNSATNFNATILPAPTTTGLFSTNNSQIELNTNDGLLTTNTSKHISITGFLNTVSNKQVGSLQLQNANQFGVISWTSLDNQILQNSDTSLLTISTRAQNPGTIWNAANTSIFSNWGTLGVEMQPLQANLQLQINSPYIILHKLNPKGEIRTSQTILPSSANVFNIAIDQSIDSTMWYGIQRAKAPLGVTILELQATKQQANAKLVWVVGSTDQIDFFTVQKQNKWQQWETLSIEKCLSNQIKYTSLDKNLVPGMNQYRILQTKKDGNVHFSNTAIVDASAGSTINIYPNPAANSISIQAVEEASTFELFDIHGKLVLQQELASGVQTISIKNIANGFYHYRILEQGETISNGLLEVQK